MRANPALDAAAAAGVQEGGDSFPNKVDARVSNLGEVNEELFRRAVAREAELLERVRVLKAEVRIVHTVRLLLLTRSVYPSVICVLRWRWYRRCSC